MRITFFEIIGELERDGSCTALRRGAGTLVPSREAPAGLAVQIGSETFHLSPSPDESTWEGWTNPATRRQRRIRFTALARPAGGTARPHTRRIVLLEGELTRGEAIEELCPAPPTLSGASDTLTGILRGSRVLTAFGEMAVEELRPGDLVHTVDEGLQPILWIGRTKLPPDAPSAGAGRRLVRIARDAFGPGLPSSELRLPPELRMLVDTPEGARLAPAAALCDPEPEAGAFELFHILFEKHQLVHVQGLVAESFLAAPHALARLGEEARAEILAIHPTLAAHPLGYGPAARPVLSLEQARARVA